MDILNEEYVEVVTVPSTTSRSVDEVYVETVTIPTVTPRTVFEFYIEVITPSPSMSVEGWGIPIN